MSIRDKVNFVPHLKFDSANEFIKDRKCEAVPINNVIYKSDEPEQQWIAESTEKIGYFRSKARSSYFRWAMTINGLHVASQKYEENDQDTEFEIKSLRRKHGNVASETLASWTMHEAAESHITTSHTIVYYGICDLHACLEECILDLYRIYKKHNPLDLMTGDYKYLKGVRKKSRRSTGHLKKWEQEIEQRLNLWERNISSGKSLKNIFLAYADQASIKKPSRFVYTDIKTWSESIGIISLLRNQITHGESKASKELASLCELPHSLGFRFSEGDDLDLRLYHMQLVEMFIHEFFNAINISLVEKAASSYPRT